MSTATMPVEFQDLPDGPGQLGPDDDGRVPVWSWAQRQLIMRPLPRAVVVAGGGSSGGGGGEGGTTDHALLSNLSYAASGHTGFEQSGAAAAAIAAHLLEADPHTGYLLADGTRTGASSQAQTFTNGITSNGSILAISPNVATESLVLRSARAAIVLGNILNGIDFQSNDTSLTAPGTVTATIQAVASMTHTATNLGTDLVFQTMAATTLSEAMRIRYDNIVTIPYQLNAGWVRNSMVAIGGQGPNDMSMLGFYDRNELINADVRGTVTITLTGSGTVTAGTVNSAFNARGNYLTITGTDATTTQIVIQIDLGAVTNNYGSTFWQPFLQYRNGFTNSSGTKYKGIVCEVSVNGTTWFKPASGGWETTDATGAEVVTGMWLGTNAQPGVTWRYARFTLTNRTTAATSTDQVWISAIGIRHYSAPYTRAYMHTNGDVMYGLLDIMPSTTAGALLRLRPGVAPTAPVDGNLWPVGNDLFYRGGTASYSIGQVVRTTAVRPLADSITALQWQNAAGTSVVNVDTTNSRVGIGNTSPANALDVTGTVQADGLRLDVTPTAETITPTHTITVSVNGTNYKIPCVAA